MSKYYLRITGDIGVEVWQDIPEWEGYYQVSNYGRVKSVSRKYARNGGMILEGCYNASGYYLVHLRRIVNGERIQHNKYLQRLVALTFLPNPHKYTQVNHKDENKTNNRVENLEWCDADYNCNYGNRNRRISISHKKDA